MSFEPARVTILINSFIIAKERILGLDAVINVCICILLIF